MFQKVSDKSFVEIWSEVAPKKGIPAVAKKLKLHANSVKYRAARLLAAGVIIPPAKRIKTPWRNSRFESLFQKHTEANKPNKHVYNMPTLDAQLKKLLHLQDEIERLKASIKKML